MKVGIIGSGNVGRVLATGFLNEGHDVMLGTRNISKEEVAINLAGKEHLSNKVIIDTTNPIAAVPPENGVIRYFTTLEESLMEKIQKIVPDAKVVKAFSCVGNAFMYKPNFNGSIPTMFICGNDDAAKKTVTDILTSFG